MSDTHLPPSLSPAEARQIDQACDSFEAGWKAGQRPHAEVYLGTIAEPVRSALLRQLLLLDWDCRRRAGDDPQASDYHTRFPGDPALIEEVCHEMTESPVKRCMASDEPHAVDTPWSGAEGIGRIDNPSHADTGADRYDLLQEIGHGGIGVVFRGRDRLLGRELAVKVLCEGYRDNPEARRRFIEEARVGSQLQHPAIVPVYELGWFGDRRPYFTMKLVEGHTLAVLLHERADLGQDLPRLLGVFEQVCQAMAYAHARGVVHRDLKPANVMVGAFGEVQVMDWGFAKVLAGDGAGSGTAALEEGATDPAQTRPVLGGTEVSHSGALMGTPAYMPPEQAQGESALIDPRTDVFALGSILCEILTGRPPYVGGTVDDVCRQAARGDVGGAHARLAVCGADEAPRDLARRCLAAERLARPADAGVVARDLTAYLASAQERLQRSQLERAAAEAREQEAVAKAKAERQARRLTLALVAAAAVVLVLAGSGWWWHERIERAQALRVATTDGKVEAALADADDWLTRQDWPQARAAAIRARDLLDSAASDHGKERVDEVLADLDMVGQLDEIRILQAVTNRSSWRIPWEKALPRYAEAFGRYGIRASVGPAVVAARVTSRPGPVREALVAGLENWWGIARGRDPAAHDWLGAVLEVVDADAWRARVRRAVVRQDRRLLEELAVQGDVARQPRATVNSLSRALFDLQAYDAVIALLRPAQLRYPSDWWINFDLGRALRVRQPPDYPEALRFWSIARALRPETFTPNHVNLGGLLVKQHDWDGVIFVSQKALEFQPDSAEAYLHLGVGLENKGASEQAQAAYRKALELNPDLNQAHYNLGVSFRNRGQVDQAIAAYRQAIRLAPRDAEAHHALGNAWYVRKDFDAALAAYARTIELNPGYAPAHNGRGNALMAKGRVTEAIAAFQQAIRLDPTMDLFHGNLGVAWTRQGRLERARTACSRAVELNPRFATHHYNLGTVLEKASDWGGAVVAYRETLRLDPNRAEAHCNLGFALQKQGLFANALAAIERGHRLGTAQSRWRYPSALWVKQAQRFVALEAKLPGILTGRERPATVAEQLEYASVCKGKGLYGDSARLYAEAFTTKPALATTLEAGHRERAACVAGLAGSGKGGEAPVRDDRERARWRKQALDWLRADLALWADLLDRSPDSRSRARSALQRWQREEALAGFREAEELAKLPESERTDCLRFWADVQERLVRCLVRPAGQ